MLYGGFQKGARNRSALVSRLMNPVREGFTGKNNNSVAKLPAGPDWTFNSQRLSHQQRQPEWYRNMPPLPNSYQRRMNASAGRLPVEPVRIAAIDSLMNPHHASNFPPYNSTRNHYQERRIDPPLDRKAAYAQRVYLDQLDHFNNSPLASNMLRNPDLNHYERASLGLEAMNVDQLRLLRGLPVGTDLYRYKVEQSKELGTVRGEVMKMIEEQRLKSVKKSLDLKWNQEDRGMENKLWADEQNKIIIQKKIREAMGNEQIMEFDK